MAGCVRRRQAHGDRQNPIPRSTCNMGKRRRRKYRKPNSLHVGKDLDYNDGNKEGRPITCKPGERPKHAANSKVGRRPRHADNSDHCDGCRQEPAAGGTRQTYHRHGCRRPGKKESRGRYRSCRRTSLLEAKEFRLKHMATGHADQLEPKKKQYRGPYHGCKTMDTADGHRWPRRSSELRKSINQLQCTARCGIIHTGNARHFERPTARPLKCACSALE